MTKIVSLDQFKAMFHEATTETLQWFDAACAEFSINTPRRCAAFFSQMHHESNGLSMLVENLNYSAERLRAVWPSRFKTLEIAKRYARNPVALGNYVYGGRMGNGPASTGDGYRYRGRGPTMLTGRDNYREFEIALGIPLLANPDLAAGLEAGARIAARFWKTRGANELADIGDVVGITWKINGGTVGLAARKKLYDEFCVILNCK
jgi:putative chitinase